MTLFVAVILGQYGGSVCEKATPAMPDDEACQVDHGIKEFSFHDELGFCSDELLLNKPPKKVVADTDRSDSGRGATSVVSGATERADDTTPQGAETCGDGVDAKHSANVQAAPTEWHPILLVIPLRLGLSEINPVYFNAIKVKLLCDFQYKIRKNGRKFSNYCNCFIELG